ncbi:MAG: hypothetical protein IAE79_01160 [Anaerolinea sp.]|nr:hypothetical protein [Anaerolinea sp.]
MLTCGTLAVVQVVTTAVVVTAVASLTFIKSIIATSGWQNSFACRRC